LTQFPESTRAAFRTLSVLIVGGDPDERSALRTSLARHVGLVDSAGTTELAQQLISRCHFDVLLVDGTLDGSPPIELVASLRSAGGHHRIILASPDPDANTAIAAMRQGIEDLLPAPVSAEDLLEAISRQAGQGAVAGPVEAAPQGRSGNSRHAIVGTSPAIRRVKDLIDRVAPLPGTVLIQGETGTGKELVARNLHEYSRRRGNFVPVNCGAIAPDLLESELFGHMKGAFTSAHQGREGLFVSAKGGTLFLDEISEMPLSLEVKLLRALEEGAIRAVGADREVPVNARIVASTQHDLHDLVRQKRFREDLYFRLNVVNISLPPLRERAEDIPLLAEHFMRRIAIELGITPVRLGEPAMERLQEHDWPGNVRELRNVIERTLMLGELAEETLGRDGRRPVRGGESSYPLDWTLEQVKDHHMRRVLEDLDGNKSAAARRLGISRKTLERRLGNGAGD
jgi:DNA-binding NtrC family response regulator